MPGQNSWEKDGVVDLEGLESDVDELNEMALTDALADSAPSSPEKAQLQREVDQNL